MKKQFIPLTLALFLVLSGCNSSMDSSSQEILGHPPSSQSSTIYSPSEVSSFSPEEEEPEETKIPLGTLRYIDDSEKELEHNTYLWDLETGKTEFLETIAIGPGSSYRKWWDGENYLVMDYGEMVLGKKTSGPKKVKEIPFYSACYQDSTLTYKMLDEEDDEWNT